MSKQSINNNKKSKITPIQRKELYEINKEQHTLPIGLYGYAAEEEVKALEGEVLPKEETEEEEEEKALANFETEALTPNPPRRRISGDSAYIDKTITFDEAWSLFILDRKSRSASKATISYYERCWKKIEGCFCLPYVDTPIDYLSNVSAQLTFMEYIRESAGVDEVSEQTVNSYLRGFRSFGNYCLDMGFIEDFTCHIKEVDAPLKDTYTLEELEKLTVKPDINNFTEFRNYTIIILLMATAARSKSIINIKIQDVDLQGGYIRLNTTKAHKVASIGLPDRAVLALREYVNRWRSFKHTKPRDPLFCTEYEEKMSKDGLYYAISHYNKRRGVEKTSLHLFRHTFAKQWIMSGGDAFSLKQVLTHSDMAMVNKYSNLYANDVKEKMETHSVLKQIKQKSGDTIQTKRKKLQ